jgi:hypothetical protein
MTSFNNIEIDSDEESIDINKNSSFNFKLPNKGINLVNDNVLFNKANISNDIISSMSSKSSSVSTSSSEDNNNKNIRNNLLIDDDSNDSNSDISSKSSRRKHKSSRHRHNRDREGDELNNKKEILYQFDRLKSKGINVPYNFDMSSNLEEMRIAYDRIKREKDVDASIKFQRKVLMGVITGAEFVNTRYDPFGVYLEGFSEQIHNELDEYDPIFEELHEKYSMSDSQMAPELRLVISIGGSGFMYHLTSKMFSNEKLPKVEEILKNNPDLMKQFQSAAANEYMGNKTSSMYQTSRPEFNEKINTPNVNGNNRGDDIFSMVSGLFGNMNSDPGFNEVNNIINNVHNNISVIPDDNMMETLSVTEDEITSIIEDTADINILKGGKKPRKKNKIITNRTLDL